MLSLRPMQPCMASQVCAWVEQLMACGPRQPRPTSSGHTSLFSVDEELEIQRGENEKWIFLVRSFVACGRASQR
jgi:hypothetical protein